MKGKNTTPPQQLPATSALIDMLVAPERTGEGSDAVGSTVVETNEGFPHNELNELEHEESEQEENFNQVVPQRSNRRRLKKPMATIGEE